MNTLLQLLLDSIDSNNQVTDASGNGLDGTVTGAVVVTDVIFGNCMEFDGTNAYVNLGTGDIGGALAEGSSTFSMAFWVKPTDLGGTDKTAHNVYNVILAKSSDSVNDNFEVGISPSSNLLVYIDSNTGDNDLELGSGELTTGAWHFVALSFNNGVLTVWLNGVEYTTTISGTKLDSGYTSPVTIGHCMRKIGVSAGLHGCLRNFRVFDSALTQSDVQVMMLETVSSSTSFRSTYPIDFNLYDKDTQNVLYIEDTSEQQLNLDITNESTQTIELNDLTAANASSSVYHFALRFRPGTLSATSLDTTAASTCMQLTTESATNWEMSGPETDASGMDVIYLKSLKDDLTIDPGAKESIVFENVGADSGQGARGTRVELKHCNMVFSSSEVELVSTRQINLSVINHRGKQNMPVHVGFVGDDGVLNDGATPNELTLRFSNTLVYDASNTAYAAMNFLYDSDDTVRSEVILSFEAGDSDEEESALGTASDLNAIEITPPTGWAVEKLDTGTNTNWVLYPSTENQVLHGIDNPNDDSHHFDVLIENIITSFPSGHTHLHISYQNIPGYWDGQKKIMIDKRPLVYRNKYVGIGTDEPQALLHVDGEIVAESLRSSATEWNENQKLQASDADSLDYFGYSVSIYGDRAIVGSSGEDTGVSNAGAAYIFHWDGSSWTQQAKLQADDAAVNDYFGRSVSIYGDRAIMGAHGEDTGEDNAGAAYIFHWDGSSWTQQAKLQASDAAEDDFFGCSVSIYGDRAIVGARYEDTGVSNAGAAYIFHWDGSSWTQQAKLQASDAGSADNFGYSVSIYGDRAIVGAYDEDTGGSDAGAAYIFHWDGSSWTQQAKLQASDAAAADNFGTSVSIYGDRAIVGAYYEDTGASSAGAAYIFHWDGSSWTQQAKLQASDAQSGDLFGASVSIYGDRAIVGAYFPDTEVSNVGAAYIFHWDGSSWTQQTKMQTSDAAENDFFGRSVSIYGDRVIVGASGENTNTGAAYIFHEEPIGSITLHKTTGNIGIGTASPSQKLHVEGETYLNGHVGIGASSPDARLHILSSAPEVGVEEEGGLKITQGSFNSLFYHNTAGDLIIRKMSETNQLVLDSVGNVGIGTDSPQNKLDVAGGALIGALTVTGASTLNGGLTVPGASTLNGGLTVTGASTLNGSLTMTGNINVLGSQFSYAGEVEHDKTVDAPNETKTSDWNIFVSPNYLGQEENNSESDNALLVIKCFATATTDKYWTITAAYKYRIRVGDGEWSDETSSYTAGKANYLLVPKGVADPVAE